MKKTTSEQAKVATAMLFVALVFAGSIKFAQRPSAEAFGSPISKSPSMVLGPASMAQLSFFQARYNQTNPQLLGDPIPQDVSGTPLSKLSKLFAYAWRRYNPHHD